MTRRSIYPPELEAEFHALATYNAEVSRGIVHRGSYVAKMALIQQVFDDWSRRWHETQGIVVVAPEKARSQEHV